MFSLQFNGNDYIMIRRNMELNIFFKKLSNYVIREIDSEKEKRLLSENVIKPNFDRLNALIEQLESSGIVINKNILLSEETYRTIFVPSPDRIIFNGTTINESDLLFLKRKFQNLEEKFEAISNTENRYNNWLKLNKKIDKQIMDTKSKIQHLIDREKKRGKTLTFNSAYHESVATLEELKDIKEDGKKLKKNMDFINSVTCEQSKLINELCYEVSILHRGLNRYEDRQKKLNNELEGNYSEYCNRALDCMLNESLVEINLTDIDIKLVEALIVSRFLSEFDWNGYDFDIRVVNWYVENRNENICELLNKTFVDLEEMIKQSNTKTKTIGGIK